MKYEFINEQEEYSDAKWAEILNVSRSGYYNWKKNREHGVRCEKEYASAVREIFDEGKGTYGANRICGIMRKRGYKASFYRVRDIMHEQGLRCVHSRRRQRSLTNSRKSSGKGYPNLVRGIIAISGIIKRYKLHTNRRRFCIYLPDTGCDKRNNIGGKHWCPYEV